MADANLPQGTGMMTLEQGVNRVKANMAKTGATADNLLAADHSGEPEATETPETPVEGEEPAAEENTEAVSADESQAETQEPEVDNRPVILPDGSEITVEEARKGYLRQADWTRKTQDIARQREALEAERQVGTKKLSDLYQQLASTQEQEPNWLQLAQDPNVDPKQLQAAQAYWQTKKASMAEAQRVIRETEQRALSSRKASAFSTLNEGKFDPAWKDPKVLKSGLDRISEYLIDRGADGQFLEQITEPWMIEIAEESRRYREAMANKPKATLAVKGKPAPIKPGAKAAASPQSESVRILGEAFRKHPTIDNAVALEKARAGLRR